MRVEQEERARRREEKLALYQEKFAELSRVFTERAGKIQPGDVEAQGRLQEEWTREVERLKAEMTKTMQEE